MIVAVFDSHIDTIKRLFISDAFFCVCVCLCCLFDLKIIDFAVFLVACGETF